MPMVTTYPNKISKQEDFFFYFFNWNFQLPQNIKQSTMQNFLQRIPNKLPKERMKKKD